MKHSPLFETQHALGAQMTDFAGWEMPVVYSSVREESLAVHQHAGLFDISHLGRIELTGAGCTQLLEQLLSVRAVDIAEDRCRYALLLNEAGGILDDLLFLRQEERRFLLIVNAATRAADLRWISYHAARYNVQVRDLTEEQFSLAVQGPSAQAILTQLCPDDLAMLKRMRWRNTSVAGVPALVSRTGYTGEDGFEIIGTAGAAETVWQALLSAGVPAGMLPCGLAARDLCRLEAGNRLMGVDMDASTSPVEAGLAWALDLNKENFIGRVAVETEIQRAGNDPVARRFCGLALEGHVLPRHGQTLWHVNRQVGKVTSGNYSFWLDHPIGAGYVQQQCAVPDTQVEIEMHNARQPARVVNLPFVARR
jgi:aminomethyltransferase